jgi:hypothetical protein
MRLSSATITQMSIRYVDRVRHIEIEQYALQLLW